ncbi:DUF2057 family protein [Marinobacter adhaerens]|uniref:DUF2057 family protein n=1 Tax=Marinobacter adhaerens TaxID=1033846 RepID=A0A851HV91_9GAMM|nr:DUF2057 family protein [Marinobacter adhaerens]NWN92650.1 DUF2057 family protein [Marinobacter adhaerens]
MRVVHVFRAALTVLALTVVAGCSTAVTKLETWEGSPSAAAEAATLKAPGAIRVTRVNGRSMTNYLMDDLALDYALLPGENEVVFTYKTIWAKSGVVENGESKVHVIKSEPQVVRFDASASETYRFEFDKPGSRREAEQSMPEFSASIVNAEGEVMARSTDWSSTRQAQAERTPLSDGQASDGQGMSGSAGAGSLERLKATWQTATEQEKKAFLRWAFE